MITEKYCYLVAMCSAILFFISWSNASTRNLFISLFHNWGKRGSLIDFFPRFNIKPSCSSCCWLTAYRENIGLKPCSRAKARNRCFGRGGNLSTGDENRWLCLFVVNLLLYLHCWIIYQLFILFRFLKVTGNGATLHFIGTVPFSQGFMECGTYMSLPWCSCMHLPIKITVKISQMVRCTFLPLWFRSTAVQLISQSGLQHV